MVTVDPEAVQAITAYAGYNIATVTGTVISPQNAMLVWGTATGGPYSNATPWQVPVKEFYDDGTFAFRYTFRLNNVQQQASTTYYCVVQFADGTASTELSWVQPGLNGNPGDVVNFFRTYQSKLAKIEEIASKGATQGWLSIEDYSYLRAAAFYTSFFNTITWVDGR